MILHHYALVVTGADLIINNKIINPKIGMVDL